MGLAETILSYKTITVLCGGNLKFGEEDDSNGKNTSDWFGVFFTPVVLPSCGQQLAALRRLYRGVCWSDQ